MLSSIKKACLAVACVFVAVFAASNRGSVAIDLWPFGVVAQMPVYLFAFAAIFIGVLIGALLKNNKET